MDDGERRRKFSFEKDRNHFYYKKITDKGYGNQDCLDFDFAEGGILCAPNVFVDTNKKKILMDAAFEGGEITGTLTVNEIRDGVDTRGRFPKTVSFTLKGDGKRQIHEIDLEGLGVAFVGSNLEFTSVGHAKIYSFEFI